MATAFQYVAALIITLALVLASSRLFFSPLRAYPGPLLTRLTMAYAGWHAIKGDIHLMTYLDHIRYDKNPTQPPDRLVFNTLTAAQDIYLNPRVAKARIYANARFRNTPSIFTALDRADHHRRRRVVGQAVSERSMRQFEPTMIAQIDISIEQLLRASQQDEVVEMTSRCKYLAMDVIGLLAFGSSWKTQTEQTLRILPTAFASLNPRWLVRGRIKKFRKILTGIISDRMALPVDAKHGLFFFFANDEKIDQAQQEGIRKSEILGEASISVNAGGTTTATVISTVFYYLSRNPSAYAQLSSEVCSTFAWASEIRQGQKLTGCKFLRAVIDVSMRICPPTPGVLWRENDPLSTEPLIVDGHVIPPGTMVGVGTYSLMHNPEYFAEPFVFRPQRWLDGDDETPEEKEARTTMRRAFIPSILGDRACAGKAVAYLEIGLTIAKTMWHFDFEMAPGKDGELGSGRRGAERGRNRPGEYQLYDRFMAEHQSPNLKVRPRHKFLQQLV